VREADQRRPISASLDHAPVGRLAGGKEPVIACLRDGWNRGPREIPFDPEKIWWLIKAVVDAATTPSSTTQSDLRLHAVELAKVLGNARKALQRAINMRPELAQDMMWAWTFLLTDGASAASVLSGQTPTDGLGKLLDQAIAGVAALEAAANLVVQWNQKPPGNQKGSGRLSRDYIFILAFLYRNTTGLQPTTSTHAKKPGGFVDFILAIRDAFGISLGDDAVFRAVKITLRELRGL